MHKIITLGLVAAVTYLLVRPETDSTTPGPKTQWNTPS